MKTPLKVGRVVAALAILATTLAGGATAASASSTDPGGGGGCYLGGYHDTGTSFTDRLFPGWLIHSPNCIYWLVMQKDGNLVLKDTAHGRVCWASATDGITDGVYAKYWFEDNPLYNPGPRMSVISPTYGTLHEYAGYTGSGREKELNVSLNDSGQVWIGYRNNFSC